MKQLVSGYVLCALGLGFFISFFFFPENKIVLCGGSLSGIMFALGIVLISEGRESIEFPYFARLRERKKE